MPETPTNPDLIQKVRILNMKTPLERKVLLKLWANKIGTTPEEMLQTLSKAEVSRIRELEKGPLYHYHTIPLDRLLEAQEDGELKSMQIQEQEGKVFESSGSRPDVVQFTRDRRKINGKLDSCGIG